MQNSAGSVPDVSTEAGMYEPFLHTQLPFLSWSEQSLQHADMWQKTFFFKSPCFHHHRLLASDHTQRRGYVAAGGVQEFQGYPLGKQKKRKR